MSDHVPEPSSFDRIQPSPFVRQVFSVLRAHVGDIVATSAVKTAAGRIARAPEAIGSHDAVLFIDTLITALNFLQVKPEVEVELRALLEREAETWTQNSSKD